MKLVLAASCGIAAAALGAVALSADPLKMSGTGSVVLSVGAGEGAGDRTPSEIMGIPIAQAAPPVAEPRRPAADDPNGQAAPPAAERGRAAPADDPNGQIAPSATEPGRPAPADDPNGQPVPADQRGQVAPDDRRRHAYADDWDGPGDDDHDRPGDDDRDGVDDPY